MEWPKNWQRYMNEIATGPCHPEAIRGEICELDCKFKGQCPAWRKPVGLKRGSVQFGLITTPRSITEIKKFLDKLKK